MSRLEDRTTPAIFTVLNADDAGVGSLRDAITQANTGAGADVINFDPTFFSTPQTIALATALPNVTGEVSFNGPGAANLTISGGGTLRPFILAIPGKLGTVNFSGMTIANGATTGNAGAIFCSDEYVTITDSVITGCTAAVQGGALNSSPYGRLTIVNSTISNNTLNSANGGGAIFMAGRSELIIRNSSLTGNTANGGNGGAIVQYGINTMLIENSTLSGNSSTKAVTTSGLPSGGGAIFVYGAPQAPSWILRNCTIAGNTAVGNGGGILVSQNATVAGSLIIQNCTITGNTANGGAGFTGGGGGISRVQGAATLNITSSVIAENTDTSSVAPDIQSAGTVNVNNSLVGDANGFTPTGTNNLPFGTATGLGPLQNNGGTVQTRVPSAGSALINAGSNPSAGTNVSALLTSTFGTDTRGPGFSRNVGGVTDIGAAEAISTAGASATAAAPDVTANGGTLYTFTVTYTTPGALDAGSLGNDDITVNGPAGSGFSQGATFVSAAGNTVTYTIVPPGGTFDAADYGSFSIDVNAGAVTFGGGAGSIPAGPAGRARFLTPATFTVTTTADTGAGSLRQAITDANNRLFTSDIIAFQAGLTGTLVVATRMTITDPVTINGPGASLFTLSGNNATALIRTQGPGILPVTITDLRFTAGNTTPNGATGGGAIFTSNEDVTLDRVIIEGNVSTTFGGGVSSGSNVAGATTPGLLTVRNSTIAGNTANGTATAGTGGGISIPFGGRLIVENSTISGNTSTLSEGGGIYVVGGSPDGVVVRNTTVFGNTAGTSGGGISLNTITGTALISNSTLVGNTTATSGGNLLVSGTGVVTVSSSVIAFGSANSGPDVSGAVTAGTSLIRDQNGATITDGGGNLPGGTDPGFVGGSTPTLANNGGPTQTIALAPGSALLNVGSNPGNLATDQRGPGFARTSGTGTDIGAFEVQVAIAPRVTAVNVNAGQANTTQRSKVTSIDVVFSAQVTFAGPVANAFQLSRIGGGAVGGFTATASVVGGVTVVTLTGFTGAETRFGSLADGRFQLTVLANQVTAGGIQLDGDGNGTGGDNFVQNGTVGNGLFSLYGDVNGDGIVNAADFGPFRNAFGTAVGNPLYLAFLDIDGDGFINAFDFSQFRTRFGSTVP